MWTVSPMLIIILGTLVCVSLLWGRIWVPFPFQKPENGLSLLKSALLGIKNILYAAIGLFLIDSVYRVAFSRILSYGHIKYIMTAVIFGLLFGIYLLFGTVLISPTWKTLLTFGSMAVGLVGFEILYYSADGIGYEEAISAVIIVGIGSCAIFVGTDILRFKFHRKSENEQNDLLTTWLSQTLWNCNEPLKKFFSTKVYIGIFAVFMVELILNFEGLTIFLWIP